MTNKNGSPRGAASRLDRAPASERSCRRSGKGGSWLAGGSALRSQSITNSNSACKLCGVADASKLLKVFHRRAAPFAPQHRVCSIYVPGQTDEPLDQRASANTLLATQRDSEQLIADAERFAGHVFVLAF